MRHGRADEPREDDGHGVIDVAREDERGDRRDEDPHELRDAELERRLRLRLDVLGVFDSVSGAHWFCPTSICVTFAGRGTYTIVDAA